MKKRQETVLKGHEKTVLWIAITPDDKYIISGDDKTIRIWNILEKRQENVFPTEYYWIQNVEQSSDGKYSYLYGENKVLIWNLLKQEQEDLFKCNNFVIQKLREINGSIILLSEDHRIGLYKDKTFSIQNTYIMSIVTICDNLKIITSSDENEVRIWDF